MLKACSYLCVSATGIDGFGEFDKLTVPSDSFSLIIRCSAHQVSERLKGVTHILTAKVKCVITVTFSLDYPRQSYVSVRMDDIGCCYEEIKLLQPDIAGRKELHLIATGFESHG